MSEKFSFDAIGKVHSCYKEKFGIPRQPGLVKVPASIEIFHDYAREEAFRELESFSHIWVMFVFHQTMREHWKSTVRPPRLGGNDRVGVFASRSMFRPNPIGLTVVQLSSVNKTTEGITLDIIGGDFLNGTPVLDIKPYLPYVDAIPDAQAGYAEQAPQAKLQVEFTSDALQAIHLRGNTQPDLKNIISNILQFDPRPAYKTESENSRTEFAMRLYDFDLKWRIESGKVIVYALEQL